MAHSTVGLAARVHGDLQRLCRARCRSSSFLATPSTPTARRPGVEWYHSAQDAVAMVRDYSKWDDLPISLPHFAESAVRAYKIAMTPPMGPVLLVADSDLQETPSSRGRCSCASRSSLCIAAGGRCRRRGGSGETAGGGGKSGAARRSRGAHRGRHEAAGRTRGDAAGSGGSEESSLRAIL